MSVINFTNWAEGLYTDVSPPLVPTNALLVSSNVNTSYKIGSILKRPGYTKIGAALQSNKSITGLHNFRQSAATQKMLATANNSGDTATQLFYSTGGNWTELTDAETAWTNYEDCKVEMEDFISYCFFVGYDSTDGVFLPPRSLTGTTFGTTNTTSMPNAKYIKRYRDRLYIGNCDITGTPYPYRVYYSSVPSAGSITWTVASDFLDIDYSEEVKGLGENWDLLVIFTEYSAYLYNQTEFKKTWDVGCSNHRTIKNSGAYMIWANRDGVWISTGGRPQNVAGRIIDFIRYANMTNSFAEVVDEEYHLYLGSVVVDGITYSKCAAILNIPTMTWRIHEYYGTSTIFGKYYSAGQDYLFMGMSSGEVFRLGKYTDTTLLTADDTTPIHSWFQTGLLSLEAPEQCKEIDKIIAYSDRAQTLELRCRVVDQNVQTLSRFTPMGQLRKYINEFQVKSDGGNFLQIEGSENGSNPYWSLFGLSVDFGLEKPYKK